MPNPRFLVSVSQDTFDRINAIATAKAAAVGVSRPIAKNDVIRQALDRLEGKDA